MAGIVATAEIDIDAPAAQVWTALTDPELIERYFFGSRVDSDWHPGSPITWSGEFEGKRYQDKGEIVEADPGSLLVVTHYSPLSGQPDLPENYHTLTWELVERDDVTHVSLTQDNNGSDDEAARAKANWDMLLEGLKTVVEEG